MENKNNNIILTIIGAATLLVAIIGASFAYFSASSNTVSQSVKTGELKVSAALGAVEGSNIKPTTVSSDTDYESMASNSDVVKLPVNVTTTGTTIASEYDIKLTTTGVVLGTAEEDDKGELSDIHWNLAKKSDDSYEKVNAGTFNGNMANQALTSQPIDITLESDATTSHVDSYVLFIYISNKDNPQNKLQGMTISASVTVDAYQKNR